MKIVKLIILGLIVITLCWLMGCSYGYMSKDGRWAFMLGEGEFQPAKKIKCDYDFSIINFKLGD